MVKTSRKQSAARVASSATKATSGTTGSSAGTNQPKKATKRARTKELPEANKENNALDSNAQEGSRKRRRPSEAPEAPDSQPPATPPRRLTTPDLEFDYDRSQLRDPRPTPGRVKRPRYDEYDMPEELRALQPPSPPKPKGRLNAVQKDELFREKCRQDPSASFHSLYICYDKGRGGSPTYDAAGFQLDYEKVSEWMRPKYYNKRRMVNGMEKRLAQEAAENKRLANAFFVEGADIAMQNKSPSIEWWYVKDKVSKDLGIPHHKIGAEEIKLWEEKGFPKEKIEDWLQPSAEDKKRFMKMLSGGSLRL